MGETIKYKKLSNKSAIALVNCEKGLLWRYRSMFVDIDFLYKEFENFKKFKKFAKQLDKGV